MHPAVQAAVDTVAGKIPAVRMRPGAVEVHRVRPRRKVAHHNPEEAGKKLTNLRTLLRQILFFYEKVINSSVLAPHLDNLGIFW